MVKWAFKRNIHLHPSLLRTFGYSVLSPKNSYLTSIFEKKQFFEAIFKMFGKAVFEVTEVKGGRFVKNGILRLKKSK